MAFHATTLLCGIPSNSFCAQPRSPILAWKMSSLVVMYPLQWNPVATMRAWILLPSLASLRFTHSCSKSA
uniref:Uncharacterized protein n=1 Tax=Arundo donax TaxID=35708 RepID=A0A0A8Y8I0_ARUDO